LAIQAVCERVTVGSMREQVGKFVCLAMFAFLCGAGCNSGNQVSPASLVSTPVSEATPGPKPAESDWKVETEKNAVTGEVTTTAYLMYSGDQNIILRYERSARGFESCRTLHKLNHSFSNGPKHHVNSPSERSCG